MERLHYTLPSAPADLQLTAPALCGVVGSGNLEVLVQAGSEADQATFSIATAVVGFEATWEAVLRAFAERHAAGRLAFAINDAGATPAVVMLRLEQALARLKESA